MSDDGPVLDQHLDRRRVLKGAGLLALGTTLWPVAAGATEHGSRAGQVLFDVAYLGDTFRPDFAAAVSVNPDSPDLRGTTFNVDGDLYPAGTIAAGSGVDPDPAEAVGHWFCRGFFITHGNRPLPQVLTMQEFLFQRIDIGDDATAMPPRDTLVTSGVEGGVTRAVRAVVGGSGRYRLTRGEATQQTIGRNSTSLARLPEQAPNFRFRFKLAS